MSPSHPARLSNNESLLATQITIESCPIDDEGGDDGLSETSERLLDASYRYVDAKNRLVDVEKRKEMDKSVVTKETVIEEDVDGQQTSSQILE